MLAAAFRDVVQKMPNKAVPIIDEQLKVIQEYTTTTTATTSYTTGTGVNLSSTSLPFDPGHRHFSSMHWLYPGLFQPSHTNSTATSTSLDNTTPTHLKPTVVDTALSTQLYEASHELMLAKAKGNGGHTSWSSAWESCIWSRLYDSNMALQSLLRILKRFTAPNMLSLHPLLVPMGEYPRCSTCFGEADVSKRRASGALVSGDRTRRGFFTSDNDKVRLSYVH